MNAEWDLLKGVAMFDDRFDDSGPLVESFAGNIDHGRLVLLAMRHAVLPAVADFLVRYDAAPRRLARGRGALMSSLHVNRARSVALAVEAERVLTALDGAGVRAACTKGSSLQWRVYDGRGTRYMSDIDLMVAPEAGDAVTETLSGLGYQPGTGYDYRTDRIVPMSRRRRLRYAASNDHLPPFHRTTGDPAVPFLAVDVATSLTWQHAAWQVPVDEALAGRERMELGGGTVPDRGLPVLAPAYDLLFVILHLFREAWLQRTAGSKDVRLDQFADIARYWRRGGAGAGADLMRLVDGHGLRRPVAWVLAHADGLFGTTMVAAADLAADADPAWISSVRLADGTDGTWHGDVDRRLTDDEVRFTPLRTEERHGQP